MRVGLLLLVILLAAGCATPGEGPDVLGNGGFERGSEGWTWLDWSPNWMHAFEIVNGSAHTGNASLRTDVVSQANHTHGIVGATRVLSWRDVDNRVPQILEGWFRVNAWEHDESAGHAYAQVVIGLGPDNDTKAAVCNDMPNTPCQVAWPLVGVKLPPFYAFNRRFSFQDDETPHVGEWIHFRIHVADDYGRLWGHVSHFDTLILYLEARYDFDNGQKVTPIHLDVQWDDVTLR